MSSAKTTWTIAAARQPSSEVVGMVSPELAHQVETLRRPSMATKLAELQRLCAEESFELMLPARGDRAGSGHRRQRVSARTR